MPGVRLVNWKGKKVLVTGATGFLGGWLCKALQERSSQVIGISSTNNKRLWKLHGLSKKNRLFKADVADAKKILKVFEKTRPAVCFHLAGLSSPSYCAEHPVEAFEVNALGSWNVLLACLRYESLVVLVSTANLYKKKRVSEETSPIQVTDLYGFTKLLMENAAAFFSEKGLNATVVRLATLYGPLDPSKNRLVSKNILAVLARKPNYNNPKYQRDFLFVLDAVQGILAASPKRGASFKLYNLSSGKTFFGKTIAKAISDIVHSQAVSLVPKRNCSISNRKALIGLGWKPVYSAEAGLRETIQWYQKNPRAFG